MNILKNGLEIVILRPQNKKLSPVPSVHILAVVSSEQLARNWPPGLQQRAFISSVCPVRVHVDLVRFTADTWHIWIVLKEIVNNHTTSKTLVCKRRLSGKYWYIVKIVHIGGACCEIVAILPIDVEHRSRVQLEGLHHRACLRRPYDNSLIVASTQQQGLCKYPPCG